MAERLSTTEVGAEIARHTQHTGDEPDRRDKQLTIAEAALLSVVALLVAWSGYAAAKWNTDSSIELANATTARIQANRAAAVAADLRTYDSSTFEAWFTAYIAGDERAKELAIRRFRDPFKVAFDAWRATSPESNPLAPKGPTYMPQYRRPGLAAAEALDQEADAAFRAGQEAATTSDKYVRLTVVLASILFLVGISTQFRVHEVRMGLILLGVGLLVLSVVQIVTLPRPPL